MIEQSIVDKFNSKRTIVGPDDCWLWSGTTSGNYGFFYLKNVKRTIPAHVVSFMIAHGLDTMPELDVMHKCHNGLCSNPSHLYIGTHKQNMLDRELAKRGNRSTSKLCIEQIKCVRQFIAAGVKQRLIGNMFNVDQSVISKIKSGTRWSYA